jgi:predicted phosphodiesterase
MMFFPSLVTLFSLASPRPPNVKPYLKMDHHMLQSVATQPNSVVWIDVENVRGKSGFELSHSELLEKAALWAKHHNLWGKVHLVVDHGSVKCGYWLEEKGLAVVFAGPSEKADDVMARDVALFETSVVVTADVELQRRCRRAAKDNLHIMPPMKFLDDLEYVVQQQQSGQEILQESSTNGVAQTESETGEEKELELSLDEEIELGNMDVEIKLGGHLLEAESILRNNKKVTNKRRRKLEKRIQTLREKLARRGPSTLNRVTSLITTQSNDATGMERGEQDAILKRWQEIRNSSPRREQTGDRVVLAERLRRHLVDSGEGNKDFLAEFDKDEHPAKTYVNYMNGYLSPAVIHVAASKTSKRRLYRANFKKAASDSDESINNGVNGEIMPSASRALASSNNGASESDISLETLTLVVVSDTHGYEQQFEDQQDGSEILPDGDMLLHLGDFAVDGKHDMTKPALAKFDHWLAKQPHKYKIVLRGNHDPFHYNFAESGALYVTKPQSITMGGFVLALVPYGSSRLLSASGGLPSQCDVLASHVPPLNYLDKTLNGRHAGSGFLNRVVHGMNGGQPRLWLCGHIHEARGVMKRKFGKGRETTIINAANANPGRASRLTHGPVVLKLDAQKDGVEIVKMEDKSIHAIQSNEGDFFDESSTVEGVREMLLAVDLGLKSGVSLFNEDGELVRYEQFHFESPEQLELSAPELVQEWEEDANSETAIGDMPWRVTHIAIEGADARLSDAWAAATEEESSLLCISPQEWRGSLLTTKEKTSGANAKAAARLIARQVVADYGKMDLHDGKFKTDVAESVVMSLYVARKLGWITREPAVRRYTNGNIVVPKGVGAKAS